MDRTPELLTLLRTGIAAVNLGVTIQDGAVLDSLGRSKLTGPTIIVHGGLDASTKRALAGKDSTAQTWVFTCVSDSVGGLRLIHHTVRELVGNALLNGHRVKLVFQMRSMNPNDTTKTDPLTFRWLSTIVATVDSTT